MFQLSAIPEWVLLCIYLFTVAPTIVVILLENRNPVKSLAWILVLIFLPVLGIILYLYLGQDYRKQKIVAKKSIRRLHNRPKVNLEELDVDNSLLSASNKHLIRLLQNNSEALAFHGNDISLYTNGVDTFDALFGEIERATKEIHIEFYIIENDEMGRRFRELLIRKASQGVRIRLIFDFVGSFHFKRPQQDELREAGIELYSFLPAHFKITIRKNRINYRNHRKIVIIDGRVGFTGGVNIADRYLTGNKLGMWRDTFMRIEGPAIHGLQNAFLTDWFFVSRQLLSGDHFFPYIPPIPAFDNVIQIVTSGPDSDWENIQQGIFVAITSAIKYVYVQTPYFMPTDIIMSALQTAALGGVDVRVMIPERTDTFMTQSCSYSYITQSLEAGVKIYLYRNAFMHSKAIVVDDQISTIGSANMDFRSYEQNFELNAFIYDEKTAVALRDVFLQDQAQCSEITLEEWSNRPILTRIKESVARLFSPLL
jgi:cardiolipin synthase A/B